MRSTEEKHEVQARIHELQTYNTKLNQRIQQNREEIKWLKQILYNECELARTKPIKITIRKQVKT